MLITPRTYSAAQTLDRGHTLPTSQRPLKFHSLTGWHSDAADTIQGARMLLSYQAGSVRVGEVVRYTISYTPAADPIYPPPAELYVKVRNTSATPLRAAYLRGPYTLYAACYPSTFDPNVKYDQQDTDGVPQFESYLKAGGSWDATITVPQRIRATPTELAAADPDSRQSVTWVIEIVSQVVFSGTAAVNFEVLVGRDEKSVQLSSTGGLSGHGLPQPAQLQEHWVSKARGNQIIATAGVYSKSITLLVDDTTSLWNSPPFPSVDKAKHADPCCRGPAEGQPAISQEDGPKEKRKKKVHLVILTHGLHSNLGADMLYLKESIDISAKRAREQAKQHRRTSSTSQCQDSSVGGGSKSANTNDDEEDDDDEQVIVKGFFGNAIRTERGIQYLGKRLAKYVLLMTYPDQSYTPLKPSKDKHLSSQLAALKVSNEHPKSSSSTSDPHGQEPHSEGHAYQISSISFVGHSLGGLIQTYAIAYIQKYSPHFFDLIKPINFIALATPFLGLSNENPVYVRFALDLGLVGRTGQDLGLSWTAPKMRSGWGAMIGGRGEAVKPQGHSDPGSKPLLRILPCGPAHEVLAKFQHRTLYSNVVNDGIVPLRTSSLLFLDWRGLDRVEKARRDNGLVGTMAEWGWAELTGANSKSPLSARSISGDMFVENRNSDNAVSPTASFQQRNRNEESHREAPNTPEQSQFLRQSHGSEAHAMSLDPKHNENSSPSTSGPWASFLSLFRPKDAKPTVSHKQTKIYKRGQTIQTDYLDERESSARPQGLEAPARRDSHEENWSYAPPRTTFLESASDLLMPPLPPAEFLLDPASRPRTIFHDRIYHPEDIPAPLPVKRRTFAFGSTQNRTTEAQAVPSAEQPHMLPHHGKDELESGLRIEEKIARAYHRDLTWRKVLVRLEPDAHNNIIVRRMFTNAYGWPVVKHLVDTHFGHTSAAQSTDFFGTGVERAKSPMTKTTRSGNEVTGQTDPPVQEASIDGRQRSPPEGADCKRDTDLPGSAENLQTITDTNEPGDHTKTNTRPCSDETSHADAPGLPDSVRQSDPDLANNDEHGDGDGVIGQEQLSEGNVRRSASQQQ